MKKQQKHQKWFHLNYGIFIPFRKESASKEKEGYFLRKKQISTINFRIYQVVTSLKNIPYSLAYPLFLIASIFVYILY